MLGSGVLVWWIGDLDWDDDVDERRERGKEGGFYRRVSALCVLLREELSLRLRRRDVMICVHSRDSSLSLPGCLVEQEDVESTLEMVRTNKSSSARSLSLLLQRGAYDRRDRLQQ